MLSHQKHHNQSLLLFALLIPVLLLLVVNPVAGHSPSADQSQQPVQYSPGQAAAVAFTQVVGGNSHTCGRTDTGGVRCWGSNFNGELGNGTTLHQSVPVEVLGLTTGVATIDAGNGSTCALLNTGTVRCWGTGVYGGLNDDGSTYQSTVPLEIVGLSAGVLAIGVGNNHACAALATGGVRCWGRNDAGQLGDGTTETHFAPVQVVGINERISALALGRYYSCALTEQGRVKCWGQNAEGQLGNGTIVAQHTPTDVSGLHVRVTAITAGVSHTCALAEAGNVMCWGNPEFTGAGEITIGIWQTVPRNVIGLPARVIALDANWTHTCTLLETENVYCWGQNFAGQLGNNTTVTQWTPTLVPGAYRFGHTSIATGPMHTCAITSNGSVFCWGDDRYGQLGSGRFLRRNTASAVSLDETSRTIDLGINHSCAVTTQGAVKCWGSNGSQRLSSSPFQNESTPMTVMGLQQDIHTAAVGNSHSCVLTETNGVKCWGGNWLGQLGGGIDMPWPETLVDVAGLSDNVTAIAVGTHHSCALRTDGRVQCWGYNRDGQLGDGTTIDRNAPTDVIDLSAEVIAITADGNHSCALTKERQVKCWGSNITGQLGDSSTANSTRPVAVDNLTGAVSMIAAGGSHTCAAFQAGGVQCWGNNSSGQLGNQATLFSQATPVWVANLNETIQSLAAGFQSTCAVTYSGRLYGWGANVDGQLGNGTFADASQPKIVTGLPTTVTAVATGSSHTCARLQNQQIYCWGSDVDGELGIGAKTYSHVPIQLMETMTSTQPVTPQPQIALVLLYAVLDNNLGDSWTRLVNNIESGVRTGMTVRLLIDGPTDNDVYLYDVMPDTNPFCPSPVNPTCDGRYAEGTNFWRLTNENSAHPDSLYQFLVDAIKAYPTTNQITLSIIGHGSGWSANVLPGQPSIWRDQNDTLGGMLWDDHTGVQAGSRSLSTLALGQAIHWATSETGRTINLLYLDGCSMGMTEVAYELRNRADYLLASPNTDWATFAYDQLLPLARYDRNGRALGEAWLATEAALMRSRTGYPFTLALTDLRRITPLATTVTAFADALQGVIPTQRAALTLAYQQSDRFDSNYDAMLDSNDNYLDLRDFAAQVQSSITDTLVISHAQAVQTLLSSVVITVAQQNGSPWLAEEQTWAWRNLGGLSLYAPLQTDEAKRRIYYTKDHLAWAADSRWDEFLATFWAGTVNGATTAAELPVCYATTQGCAGLANPLPVQPPPTVFLPTIWR